MDSRQILDELGSRLGIEMEYGADGSAAVTFDSDDVEFKPVPGGLLVLAEIAGSCGCEELYGDLLASNLPGTETGAMTVSLDRGFETFMLHRVLPAESSYEDFEAALVLFIRTLRSLKEKCAGNGAGGADASEEHPKEIPAVMDLLNAIRA